jgi:hypothetical protein
MVAKVAFVMMVPWLLWSCLPPKGGVSRLRSGVTVSQSVTITPDSASSTVIGLAHNSSEGRLEQYKMSSLDVSVPKSNGVIDLEGDSNTVRLAPVKFKVSMTAVDSVSSAKLECLSQKADFGKSSIQCSKLGGVNSGGDPNILVANLIIQKKIGISAALAQLKANHMKDKNPSQTFEQQWKSLERSVMPGGKLYGKKDAILSEILAFKSPIKEALAQRLAAAIIDVYRRGNQTGQPPQSGPLSQVDHEIAKYVLEQPGATVTEALYFVGTNIVRIPNSSAARWTKLETTATTSRGDVYLLRDQINAWGVNLGYSPMVVAEKVAKNTR